MLGSQYLEDHRIVLLEEARHSKIFLAQIHRDRLEDWEEEVDQVDFLADRRLEKVYRWLLKTASFQKNGIISLPFNLMETAKSEEQMYPPRFLIQSLLKIHSICPYLTIGY